MADPVKVIGLRELRRDLRKIDKDAPKAVAKVVKAAAVIVATAAEGLVRSQSGRLASSIRGTTRGDRGIVRSTVPYAGVQEYGGTIRPRGTAIEIIGQGFVEKAIENKRDEVAEAIGYGIEALAVRNGWK